MGATWKCNGHRVWCCRNDLFSNKTTARREFFVCLPMLRICSKTLQSLMIWITCTSKTIAPSTLEYHSSPTRKSSAHWSVLFHKIHYSLPSCHRLHCINDRSKKQNCFCQWNMEHLETLVNSHLGEDLDCWGYFGRAVIPRCSRGAPKVVLTWVTKGITREIKLMQEYIFQFCFVLFTNLN